jgi:hypothetical protein
MTDIVGGLEDADREVEGAEGLAELVAAQEVEAVVEHEWADGRRDGRRRSVGSGARRGRSRPVLELEEASDHRC